MLKTNLFIIQMLLMIIIQVNIYKFLKNLVTFSKESLSGYIYECICLNYSFKDIKPIVSFIRKYYKLNK